MKKKKTNVIVVQDSDYGNLFGLLITDHTKKEVEKLFWKVKNKLPYDWEWQHVLNEMTSLGWDYTWETELKSLMI